MNDSVRIQLTADAIQSAVLDGQVSQIESELDTIDEQLDRIDIALKQLIKAKNELMSRRVRVVRSRNNYLDGIKELAKIRKTRY